MSNRVQILSEVVANQIAAGEVIERPASVVKELIENSLDAGATRIEVEIQRGGKNLIRVTDNGHGMSYDDALLCLERHATSKIKEAGDLLSISSYGFRGEAIPSIASVSRFRLLTREQDSPTGTEILMDGGKLIRVNEAGCAPGTVIEVRSLFSHLPARRKFLRTETTEWSHIEQFLRIVALARPHLHLIVHNDGAVVAQYPEAKSLMERLPMVFGKRWVEDVLPIESEKEGMSLRGIIGKPGISRANRHEQFLFVNGRPVQNATLNFALLEGYHNSLMKGRYPVAALFLEIDPRQVDVNVHPAKREVRFRDDSTLRSFVAQAIAEALRGKNEAPVEVTFSKQQTESFIPPASPVNWFPVAPKPSFSGEKSIFTSVVEVEEPARNHDLRVLGIIHNLYIVAENPQGLVLVDQHAAHERILFEQMLKRVANEEILSQALLLPVTLDLLPQQAQFLRTQIPTLQKVGVGVSEMGGSTFMIDSLPPMVKTSNVEDFFRAVLVDLQEAMGEVRKQRRLSEEVIAKTVCRHAVKANDILRIAEVEKLLIDLHACDLPYTCPHGRPTMILISAQELEKKFGRLTG